MTSRCKANPCCGDPYKCIVPLPQYRSGLWHMNKFEDVVSFEGSDVEANKPALKGQQHDK